MKSSRTYLTIWFILSIAYVLHGENRKIDSLNTVLRSAKEDTNKIITLNNLALEIRFNNTDSSISLSIMALDLSKKLNWEPGVGRSEHCLGEYYWRKGDFPKALEYDYKALAIWKKLFPAAGGKNGALTLSNIGIVFYSQGDYRRALDDYLMAMKIYEETKDKNGIAKILGNVGLVYYAQGDYSKALDYYFKRMKMDDESGNKSNMANNLGNIGIVYRSLGNNSKALDYYFKALKIAEELGNKNYIANWLGTIGGVYHAQGDYKKALDYYLKALKMTEELGNRSFSASWIGNIGNVCKDQGNFPKALDYYFKALKIAKEVGDKGLVTGLLCNISSVYIKMKKYKEAEECLKNSSAICDSLHSIELKKDIEELYFELDSSLSNFKGAFEHYKNYVAARDSITNDENAKKQTRTEMQYVFDKKLTADSISNAEHAKQEQLKHDQEIKQQKIYTYGGAMGFILMLIVAGVSFRAYRNKQKANEIISHQKELVEEKQKEILDSIHYAKRIQHSLLPTEKYIERNLNKLRKG